MGEWSVIIIPKWRLPNIRGTSEEALDQELVPLFGGSLERGVDFYISWHRLRTAAGLSLHAAMAMEVSEEGGRREMIVSWGSSGLLIGPEPRR